MKTIPSYAVDLLIAAKRVACPPYNAMPEHLVRYHECLVEAVEAFELAMPVIDGVICETSLAHGEGEND